MPPESDRPVKGGPDRWFAAMLDVPAEAQRSAPVVRFRPAKPAASFSLSNSDVRATTSLTAIGDASAGRPSGWMAAVHWVRHWPRSASACAALASAWETAFATRFFSRSNRRRAIGRCCDLF